MAPDTAADYKSILTALILILMRWDTESKTWVTQDSNVWMTNLRTNYIVNKHHLSWQTSQSMRNVGTGNIASGNRMRVRRVPPHYQAESMVMWNSHILHSDTNLYIEVYMTYPNHVNFFRFGIALHWRKGRWMFMGWIPVWINGFSLTLLYNRSKKLYTSDLFQNMHASIETKDWNHLNAGMLLSGTWGTDIHCIRLLTPPYDITVIVNISCVFTALPWRWLEQTVKTSTAHFRVVKLVQWKSLSRVGVGSGISSWLTHWSNSIHAYT